MNKQSELTAMYSNFHQVRIKVTGEPMMIYHHNYNYSHDTILGSKIRFRYNLMHN